MIFGTFSQKVDQRELSRPSFRRTFIVGKGNVCTFVRKEGRRQRGFIVRRSESPSCSCLQLGPPLPVPSYIDTGGFVAQRIPPARFYFWHHGTARLRFRVPSFSGFAARIDLMSQIGVFRSAFTLHASHCPHCPHSSHSEQQRLNDSTGFVASSISFDLWNFAVVYFDFPLTHAWLVLATAMFPCNTFSGKIRCLGAFIVVLGQVCEGGESNLYTSTVELQMASLELCRACRSIPTLHVRVMFRACRRPKNGDPAPAI